VALDNQEVQASQETQELPGFLVPLESSALLDQSEQLEIPEVLVQWAILVLLEWLVLPVVRDSPDLLARLGILVLPDLPELLDLMDYLEQLDRLVIPGCLGLRVLAVRKAVRDRWELLVCKDRPDRLEVLEWVDLQDLLEQREVQVLLMLNNDFYKNI